MGGRIVLVPPKAPGSEDKYFVTLASLPADPGAAPVHGDILAWRSRMSRNNAGTQESRRQIMSKQKYIYWAWKPPDSFEMKFPEALTSLNSQNSFSLCSRILKTKRTNEQTKNKNRKTYPTGKVGSRKINPGKIWKSWRLYETFIHKLIFFFFVQSCVVLKTKIWEYFLKGKQSSAPAIHLWVLKQRFVCVPQSLSPWKQTLTWKTFQGNTLNQHPGINLQNAIQAWLFLEWMQAAYE